MGLLPRVGRTRPKLALGITLIYVVLIVGGVSMVYPYLVTITSAMTDELDYEQFNPYPKYWFDRSQRYLKFLAEKYALTARFDHFKAAYHTPSHWGGFRDVGFQPDVIAKHFPLFGAEQDPARWDKIRRIAADYEAFIRTQYATRATSENLMPVFLVYNLPVYQAFSRQRYETLYLESEAPDGVTADDLSTRELERRALVLMAQIRGDAYQNFDDMTFDMVANLAYDLPKWIPGQTPRHLDLIDWVRSLPPDQKMPVTRHFLWTKFLYDQGWGAAKYNRVLGMPVLRKRLESEGFALPAMELPARWTLDALYTAVKTLGARPAEGEIQSLYAAPFPSGSMPAELAEAYDEFMRQRWPARLLRLTGDHTAHRREYVARLEERYVSLSGLNKVAQTDYKSWGDVPYFAGLPYPHETTSAHQVNDAPINALSGVWRDYVQSVPLDQREMVCPERSYQQFLLAKYKSLGAINAAYGWTYARVADVALPIPEFDYADFVANQSHYFWQFATFNFSRVIAFIATKGRALWNTLILVCLTIAATLTVNPLAAYALSRFQLRGTQQILIFLLATMAFPPEVAMIPAFLLLRDLGMLNTFAALILPRLANGFSIFLLKGFFDSLPKELYEAASIDGASELRMFTTITFPLCKPILAVIALQAFMAAYGGFMWAFLVCQDDSMWTLMVWLYQFQQKMRMFPFMTMAALVLASLPTLIVFLFCQKIILRGIIIPTMK